MSSELEQEIERVREAGVIGKRGRLVDLFDFIAARSLSGLPPKETEIATSVFGRSVGQDGEDSSVRVYVHRLRKKLEEYYLREGAGPNGRLILPRGAYAFELETGPDPVATPVDASAVARSRSVTPWLIGVLAACLIVILFQSWALMSRTTSSAEHFLSSPVWAPLAERNRPLLIVLGDYYIFGEFEDGLFLNRLIRDFDINSSMDLTDYLLDEPELIGTYVDVSLGYLPVSSAHALNDLLPPLVARQPEIMMASDLTEAQIRQSDIIYLGLTSGLGMLQDTVFADSRFQPGRTFDELVDTTGETEFVSDEFQGISEDMTYRDFALFSLSEGPGDGLIWVMAGTRDTGLIGLSDMLHRRDWAQNTLSADPVRPGYQAVFEVTGQRQRALAVRLVGESMANE